MKEINLFTVIFVTLVVLIFFSLITLNKNTNLTGFVVVTPNTKADITLTYRYKSVGPAGIEWRTESLKQAIVNINSTVILNGTNPKTNSSFDFRIEFVSYDTYLKEAAFLVDNSEIVYVSISNSYEFEQDSRGNYYGIFLTDVTGLEQGKCTPNCTNIECGFDTVCNYLCGTCPAGKTCINSHCVSTSCTQQDCINNGKECGVWTFSCGQINCGDCEQGESCDSTGHCVLPGCSNPTTVCVKDSNAPGGMQHKRVCDLTQNDIILYNHLCPCLNLTQNTGAELSATSNNNNKEKDIVTENMVTGMFTKITGMASTTGCPFGMAKLNNVCVNCGGVGEPTCDGSCDLPGYKPINDFCMVTGDIGSYSKSDGSCSSGAASPEGICMELGRWGYPAVNGACRDYDTFHFKNDNGICYRCGYAGEHICESNVYSSGCNNAGGNDESGQYNASFSTKYCQRIANPGDCGYRGQKACTTGIPCGKGSWPSVNIGGICVACGYRGAPSCGSTCNENSNYDSSKSLCVGCGLNGEYFCQNYYSSNYGCNSYLYLNKKNICINSRYSIGYRGHIPFKYSYPSNQGCNEEFDIISKPSADGLNCLACGREHQQPCSTSPSGYVLGCSPYSPYCSSDGVCRSKKEDNCVNNFDDDCDGKIDAQDTNCAGTSPFFRCDYVTRTPSCNVASDCGTDYCATTPTCDNGWCNYHCWGRYCDNGISPVNNLDCVTSVLSSETGYCSDQQDNDCDTKTDMNDTDCQCTPNCAGKQCGSNGCGGSCGTCSGSTPKCKDPPGTCVQCLSDSDCTYPKVCINNVCSSSCDKPCDSTNTAASYCNPVGIPSWGINCVNNCEVYVECDINNGQYCVDHGTYIACECCTSGSYCSYCSPVGSKMCYTGWGCPTNAYVTCVTTSAGCQQWNFNNCVSCGSGKGCLNGNCYTCSYYNNCDNYDPTYVGCSRSTGDYNSCDTSSSSPTCGSEKYDCTDGIDNDCDGKTDSSDPDCSTSCSDECYPSGKRECLSSTSYRQCGYYDTDPCLDWSGTQYCSTGQTCDYSSGNCISGCTNDCQTGQKRCLDFNTYQTCGYYDTDSCLDWGNDTDCSANEICNNGVCECDSLTCVELGFQCGIQTDNCGQSIDCGDCSDLGVGYFCNATGKCQLGQGPEFCGDNYDNDGDGKIDREDSECVALCNCVPSNQGEICNNNKDDDCDNLIDEYCGTGVCTNGQTRQCGITDVGACEYGTQTCTNNQWGSCVGAIYPTTEVCGNGVDEDCDNQIDEGCTQEHCTILWDKTITLPSKCDTAYIYYVIQDADNNYFFIGDAFINLEGYVFYGKLDTAGNQLWTKSLRNRDNKSISLLASSPLSAETIDGYIMLYFNTSGRYLGVMKVLKDGTTSWQNKIPVYAGSAFGIIKNNLGRYVVFTNSGYLDGRMFFREYDSSGTLQRQKNISFPSISSTSFDKIIQTPDNGYALVGSLYVSPGKFYASLAKFDSDFNLQWYKQDLNNESRYDSGVMDNSLIVTTGNFALPDKSQNFVIRYWDLNGNMRNESTLLNFRIIYGYWMSKLYGLNYISLLYFANESFSDYLIYRYNNSNGLWRYILPNNSSYYTLQQTNDNNFILGGSRDLSKAIVTKISCHD